MERGKLLTREDIFRILKSRRDVLDRYQVKRIGLFGSRATGRPSDHSDIDFLVEFEKPTFDNFVGLIDSLEKIFELSVDLLTPDGVESIRSRDIAEDIKKSVVYV